MNKKTKPRRYSDDAPLTKAEMKTARHFRDCPPDFIRAVRASIGRPTGRTKTPVHISLDSDLVLALRKSGKGWQTRANEVLRKSMKMDSTSKDSHA